MKAWKAAEYRAARTLSGKRVVLSGGSGAGCRGDVELPGWHVEVKYRKQFSIFPLFFAAEDVALAEGKNTLLILTQKGTQGQLAVMRIEYFNDLEGVKPNGRKG